MNEYLYKMMLAQDDNLSDEEVMYMVANEKLHTKRKKKENLKNDEGIYNDIYCF